MPVLARLGGAVDKGPSDFDRASLVDQAVLDRLERTNRVAKRIALLGVFDRGFVGGRGDADQFGYLSDPCTHCRAVIADLGWLTRLDDVNRCFLQGDSGSRVVIQWGDRFT